MKHCNLSRNSRRLRGQAATEFLVIFPVLVMLVFGIIQFGLLYQTRATLNHATLLAARAGAMHNGSMSEMRSALARGLAPLFASQASASGYANALLKAQVESSAGYAAVDILNPTSAALSDFGRARLDEGGGNELPNDTLNYRRTTPGSSSNLSIQDANILHIRVTYCSRLIVPIIDRILYATLNSTASTPTALTATGMSNPMGTSADPAATSCGTASNDGRRIKVQSEAFVRMQSAFYASNAVASSNGTPGGGIPGAGVGGIPPPGTGTVTGGGISGYGPSGPVDPVDPTCL
jgi:Flp pilus assembly protein TadG